jgi:hypothetical protein
MRFNPVLPEVANFTDFEARLVAPVIAFAHITQVNCVPYLTVLTPVLKFQKYYR